MADRVERVRNDLRTVEGVEEEYRVIVKDAYQRTMDIGQAMGEMYRLKELKQRETERTAVQRPDSVSEPPEVPDTAKANPTFQPENTASPGVMPDVPPARDPFLNPPKEKQYRASFTVYGTRNQILSVRQFLTDNGIRFEKGAK